MIILYGTLKIGDVHVKLDKHIRVVKNSMVYVEQTNVEIKYIPNVSRMSVIKTNLLG